MNTGMAVGRGRQGGGAVSRVLLPGAILVLLAAVTIVFGAGCASEAELLRILQTTQDLSERQNAALDLAGKHSLEATMELATVAATSPIAAEGLKSLREEYLLKLFGPLAEAYDEDTELDEKTRLALSEIVDCLAAIGDREAVEALGGLICGPEQAAVQYGSAAQFIPPGLDLQPRPLKSGSEEVETGQGAVGQLVPSTLDLQLYALEVLSGLRTDASFSALIEAASLNGEEPSTETIRAAARQALIGIGEPAIPSLVAALGSQEWAEDVLVGIGVAAIPQVTAELDNTEALVCYRALGVLLRLFDRDQAAVGPTLVKADMVSLLIEARSKAEYGDDRDGTAETVLAQIGEPAVKPLMTLVQVGNWAYNVLVKMGSPAVPTMVAALGSQEWAEKVLTGIGVAAIPQVTAELDNTEALVRYRALGVLLRLFDRDQAAVAPTLVKAEMVPLLIEARSGARYGDERDGTAETVLAQIGEPAVKPLMTLVQVGNWAYNVLVKMGSPAVPTMVAALGSQEWAEKVLTGIGVAAIPQVTEALDSGKAVVRYEALGVLLRLFETDRAAVAPTLVKADMVSLLIKARLKAEYGDERDGTAETVLAQIGEPAVEQLIDVIDEYWAQDLLVTMGATAVPGLTSALSSGGRDTNLLAAELLLRIHDISLTAVATLTADMDEENLKEIARHYLYYIMLGEAGSEYVISRALLAYGGKQMGLDCLNCGNATLDEAGRQWGTNHGYYVYSTSGGYSGPSWGG